MLALFSFLVAMVAFILFVYSFITGPIAFLIIFFCGGIIWWQLSFFTPKYEEPVMKGEWELAPIVPGKKIYAIEVHGEEVIYRHKGSGQRKEGKIYYIRYMNYEINESENEKAYLRYYEQKQKISIWYIPFAGNRAKYVISIPKGGEVI